MINGDFCSSQAWEGSEPEAPVRGRGAAEVLHRHRECLEMTVSSAEPDLLNQGNLHDRFWAQSSLCLSRQPLGHMLPSAPFQELLYFLLAFSFLRQQLTTVSHTCASWHTPAYALVKNKNKTETNISFMLNALHSLLLVPARGISYS